jgi:tetratricopeptide (TPR) repeat protein
MLALPQISFRHVLKLFALSFFALSVIASSSFTVRAQNEPERERAFQLYKDAKYVEALPLFEKLAVAHPQDSAVIETLGLLVYAQSAYLKTPEERKQARKRGRETLLQAQNLGSNSPLLIALIQGIPADGGNDQSFSPQKEVNESMKEGEAAFAKGEFSTALEMYQRALLLDPKLYEAALYIGDVYFKSADQVKASEWFAHAVAINPDRETAYRYWGDSLMKQGKVTEAGEKFAEAYIAEPYSRFARAGFVNWGERVNIPLAHPRVELPANVTRKGEKETTITLDPNTLKKDDKTGSSAAWLMYSLVRSSWVTTEFAKQYPNEKTYRHSLKEEAAAIRAALSALDEKKSQADDVDPSLQILAKLDKDGLLEAFILLALPDEGIATDFTAYRKNHTENLRRYVKQYVLTGGRKQ